jgi:hypothetical protein
MGLTYRQTLHDLDAHFASGQYQFDGGGLQGLAFANAAITLLSEMDYGKKLLNTLHEIPGITLHEYGCAEGDARAYIQTAFPDVHVTGIDKSIPAIKNAQRRWPTVHFEEGDWHDPRRKAGFIFLSNCLPQVDDPIQMIRGLLPFCNFLFSTSIPWPNNEWLEDLPFIETSGVRKVRRPVPFGPEPCTTLEEHLQLVLFKGEVE